MNRPVVSSVSSNRLCTPRMASGKAAVATNAATTAPTRTRRPTRVKNRPDAHIVMTKTATPSTTELREPVIGTTEAVTNVPINAAVRARRDLESRPNDRSKVGTRTAKSPNPEGNAKVEATRARPVLATTATSEEWTSSPFRTEYILRLESAGEANCTAASPATISETATKT